MTRIVSLGDIVEIKGGGTPDKSVESYWGGEIPWASVKDFKSAEITQTVDSITPLGVANSATNVIPAGSILVPTRMAVGKVAINAVDMAINQDLKALKLKAGVDTRYLLNALMAKAPSLEAQATGATVKGITLDVLRSLQIPLPPLEEQKRIAAILDQADDIRRKRQHAIDRLNQLGQAIFYEMFGDPIRNPMGWDTSSLGSISTINPRNDTTLEDSDDVTFLPMAAVSEQGKIISEEVRTYGSVKKGFTFFRKGDVLLAKITPCFENGKSAKTDDMKHPVGFGSTEFHVLRPSAPLHPSYLFSILHDKRFRNKAEECMTGSAGQKRVPSTYLKEYKIPLPPMELQEEFASRIEAIDGLVAQNENMLTIQEKLFASLQHRAFAGEL